MERILLLVDNKRDRKLIEEALDYEIWPAETEHPLDQTFELAIIDGPSLNTGAPKFANAAKPKNQCCCRFCSSGFGEKAPCPYGIWADWWTTLIVRPLDMEELRARMANLLRIKSLGKNRLSIAGFAQAA